MNDLMSGSRALGEFIAGSWLRWKIAVEAWSLPLTYLHYLGLSYFASGGMHRLWKDRLVEKLRPRPGQKHLGGLTGQGGECWVGSWSALEATHL